MRAADRIGTLFSPCRHLPQGDNGVWVDHRFTWKLPESWIPRLTAWLTPRSCADAMRRLDPGIFRDLCWDGPDWGDVLGRCLTGNLECHADALAEALERSVLRTFHGCRTDDAGSYFREGLRVHDREAMTARLRSIVERHEKLRWMKETLDAAIKQVGNELDHGRLYVVADDTVLLRYAAHYLINGSEWMMAVLGPSGWQVLRRIGAPTLLEIDLPLHMSSIYTRKEFATKMLHEWARLACNLPDWSAPIDFSFCLRTDIPAACIVSHSHPTALRDPHDRERIYRTPNAACKHCAI